MLGQIQIGQNDWQANSDEGYSPRWFLNMGLTSQELVEVIEERSGGVNSHHYYIINYHYYQNEITCSGTFIVKLCNTCRLELQGCYDLPKLGEQIPVRYNCQEKAGSVIPVNGPKWKSPQSLLRCKSIFWKIPMLSLFLLLCVVQYSRS